MPKPTFIPESEAPPQMRSSIDRMKYQYDGYVRDLPKGQVGKMEMEGDETPKSVATRLRKAGARVGTPVIVWEHDGTVYYKRQ